MIGEVCLEGVSVRECSIREIGDGIDSGRLCREKETVIKVREEG